MEKNTEDNNLVFSEQKNKPTRPQAAVQGITPTLPAPVREDKSRDTSLLDKFFSWFKPVRNEEITTDLEKKQQIDIDKNKMSQERTRSRGRRGRNRNERNKDASMHKQAKPGELTDSGVTEATPAEYAISAEPGYSPELSTERKNVRNKPSPQSTPDLEEKLLSNNTLISETENHDGIDAKPVDRKRTRRHRGNKNRDQSVRAKTSVENQDAPDTPSTNEENSANFIQDIETSMPVIEPAKKQSGRKEIAKHPADDPEITGSNNLPDESPIAQQQPEARVTKTLPDFTESGLVMIETPPEKVELVTEEIIIPKRPRRRKTKQISDAPVEPLMQIETRE